MAWPRLTETLIGPQDVGVCQCCEREATELWQECDEADRPEFRFLWLCRACAEKLIEPHPRLYVRLNTFAPAPGAMECCKPCRHRDGVRCTSPAMKFNGGPGVAIRVNQVGFTCSRGKGGGCRPIYDGPPKCEGLEAQETQSPIPNP